MNKKKLVTVYISDIYDKFMEVYGMGYRPKDIFVEGIKCILKEKKNLDAIEEIKDVIKKLYESVSDLNENVSAVSSEYVTLCGFRKKKGDIIALLNEIGPYTADIEDIIRNTNIDHEDRIKILNLLGAIKRVQLELLKKLKEI